MVVTETSTYSSFITEWLPITLVLFNITIVTLGIIIAFKLLKKK